MGCAILNVSHFVHGTTHDITDGKHVYCVFGSLDIQLTPIRSVKSHRRLSPPCERCKPRIGCNVKYPGLCGYHEDFEIGCKRWHIRFWASPGTFTFLLNLRTTYLYFFFLDDLFLMKMPSTADRRHTNFLICLLLFKYFLK